MKHFLIAICLLFNIAAFAQDSKPVYTKLSQFTGINVQNHAEIRFQLTEVSEGSVLEIERSLNRGAFAVIARLATANKPNLEYAFTDQDLLSIQTAAYRVWIVSVSGERILISKTISLQSGPNRADVSVIPNPIPAGQSFQLKITNQISEQASVQILALSGQVMRALQLQLSPGSSQFRVETGGLSAGTYYLKIQVGNQLRPVMTKIILTRN